MTSDRIVGCVSPRNRLLYEQGRALRAEIRDMLLRHPPLAPPLTAKRIRDCLNSSRNPAPSLRTIQFHVHAIRGGNAAAAGGQDCGL
jgi:hypothetical protein